MSKVVVIGAGASGIIAALEASKNNSVILVDSNSQVGKKILLTGNGRCNYWNEDISLKNYHSDNNQVLNKILDNKDTVLSNLKKMCIFPRVKNGYYYPYSNQASSIREIFERAIDQSDITFIPNFKVVDVQKIENKFVISSEDEVIKADKVIVATGSKATPRTGSDGFGYEIAESFGHTVNTVSPSLCRLMSDDKCCRDWENVRCEARVSMIVDNETVGMEEGELQLTKNGISGIVTFNLSGIASRNIMLDRRVQASINFLPNISDFFDWFDNLNKAIPNKTLEEMFESLFNYKLMFLILKRANLSKTSKWVELDMEEKLKLASTIENFRINIIDFDYFENAQVCTGGVSLDEINPETMESDRIKGLYFTGEVLDVDGKCGGFNLAFAFITGYIAGKSV